jgi:hypothetical protein
MASTIQTFSHTFYINYEEVGFYIIKIALAPNTPAAHARGVEGMAPASDPEG